MNSLHRFSVGHTSGSGDDECGVVLEEKRKCLCWQEKARGEIYVLASQYRRYKTVARFILSLDPYGNRLLDDWVK